ncbi:MAG: ATP-binding cassette domain-containing protein [Ferrovibrio sp.]|nr:ATP-binding cassette domain-containing protein [Ferrovibrio sp.]
MSTPKISSPVLEAKDIVKHFKVKDGRVARAIDGVSFELMPGETLGLIGESGCGKSTLARVLSRLEEPTGGTIHIKGQDITHLSHRQMIPVRQNCQMIFQDAVSSLNPRANAGELVAEPLRIHRLVPKSEIKDRVAELFKGVGLNPDMMTRYPHEMSGGQCQRVNIARAISLNPDIIIADEAVSALDVSIQAQVINLLGDIQSRMGLSYIFITHDMAVVGVISHRIAVMYLGKFVEYSTKAEIIRNPLHPYTQALLDASPIPNPSRSKRQRQIVRGELPSPISPPSGCHFHPRCPKATELCKTEKPVLREVLPGHMVSCHLV